MVCLQLPLDMRLVEVLQMLSKSVTIDYNVIMPVLSIRFKRPGAYERLKRCAAQQTESISSIGERLIDEGLRMQAHPGVVFRDGPTGRRAGLAAGPDVWEIIDILRGLQGSVDQRVTAAAAQLGLTETQARSASRYYAEFTDEINAEIADNNATAEREMAIWNKERQLLSR